MGWEFWAFLFLVGVVGTVLTRGREKPRITLAEDIPERPIPKYVAQPIQPQPRRAEADHEAPGFDMFMAGRAEEIGGKWLNARIAGVTHRNPDGTSRQESVRQLQAMEQLELRRDPDNPYSKYAVRVCTSTGYTLGYIPEFIARDVSDALDSGGEAQAFVRHVRQSGATNWGAAIGVVWAVKLSPRNEFRKILDKMLDAQAEEWCWAKLSGLDKINDDGVSRQEIIATLKPKYSPQVRPIGDLQKATKVNLTKLDGTVIASLSKGQASMVIEGMRDGRLYGTLVFEVRERVGKPGLEPVIALVLLNEGTSWTTQPD